MHSSREKTIRLSTIAAACALLVCAPQESASQELRWLRVGQLQSFLVDYGSEPELSPLSHNSFSWPAQYGDNQYTSRMKGLWLGATNFLDPSDGKTKSVKVVGSGPRYDAAHQPDMIFSQTIKLIARSAPPTVIVDNVMSSANALYDTPDDIDPALPCDRMVVITFNTSLGVSVTKKVMAFAQQNHDNYFVYDYVFKNTGIWDKAGHTSTQTLNNFWVHFNYRYAFAGVTSSGWGSTWGAFESEWGETTVQHDFGPHRSAFVSIPGFYTYSNISVPNTMRGFYSYYGPEQKRSAVSYDQDWGCPNQNGGGTGLNGLLGSAKYAGAVTLFASQSPHNYTVDDGSQPQSTSYYGSDETVCGSTVSQYDDVFMQGRWARMIEAHLPQSMEQSVGTKYVTEWGNSSPRWGGEQGQGFGPYTLAPGDSIHIVFAEGISGISWEKCREVGSVWYEYYKATSTPSLRAPDGSTAASYTDYARGWVQTGRDSLFRTFLNATANFQSGYAIPRPPNPPSRFTVMSMGDGIGLTWSPPADTAHLAGYIVYRSENNIKDYRSFYTKVFESNASVTSWIDTSAVRGFNYYYYIQSKDNGTRNDVHPGIPLASSLFLTMTSSPANLLRPAADLLGSVRVVPNPFDIRARKWQFSDVTGTNLPDRIAFYGIPPQCKLKIFTEDGTLVWEKDHTNGSGDEYWDSKTKYGQIVASGIYILYVEVTQDIYAEEEKTARWDMYDENLKLLYPQGSVMFHPGDKIFSAGQHTFRKLVVIR